MTAGNSTPLSDGASAVLLASRGVGGRARPAGAGVLRRRADRGRRPRAQGRGAADGAGLRDAADARPQRARASPTSTCSRSTRRSRRRWWRRWRRGATRCSRASGSGATSRWARSTASKLNVNGGSLAAGHPFAATGGRIVASLAKALDERGSGRGVIIDLRGRRPGRRRDPGEVHERSLLAAGARCRSRAASAKRIGLPQPVELERGLVGELSGRVLLGGAGRLAEAAARVLAELGVDAATALDDPGARARRRAGLDAAVFNPEAPADQRFKALVFDATGIESSRSWSSCSASSIRRSRACCRPGA